MTSMGTAVATTPSHSDHVTIHPIAIIRVKAVAKHLLDSIEAVDDRHIVDNFFVAKLNEMRDAIADSAAAITFGCSQFAEHLSLIHI